MTLSGPEGLCVLVVDDEAPARLRLTDLLRQDARIASILEAANGLEAVSLIETEKPDLVFLDVQMPELNGLGVIERVGPSNMPMTVFVTAYDQHAISAFESNALDYLLKPFSDERLESTMLRVEAMLADRRMREFGQSVMRMMAGRAIPGQYLERIALKSNGRVELIPTVDIDWIESSGVYVTLHVANRELLYRASLNELSVSLDPSRFIRVHRSAIVNVNGIVRLEPLSHGEFELVLKCGARPRLSRTFRPSLEKWLGYSL
jgi:two-component system, LytTR family, response regulator